MILGLLVGLSLLAPSDDLRVKWEAPPVFITGEAYRVHVELIAPDETSVDVPAWMLASAGFNVNGRPLDKRSEGQSVRLEPRARLELDLDLSAALAGLPQVQERDFRISYGVGRSAQNEQRIIHLEGAERGIDFRQLPAAQLANYHVVLRTTQGDLWLELWPEDAPEHTRGFLDLCYTGFYDGTLFHRVVPGRIAEGGIPRDGAAAPPSLPIEVHPRRHLRGVISMMHPEDTETGARGDASSLFLITHGVAPSLDDRHVPFGRIVRGLDALDAIVASGNKSYAPDDERSQIPPVPQVIQKAIVVRAPRVLPTADR